MSAHMVDDITINKVVSFFQLKALDNKHMHPLRLLREAGYDMSKDANPRRLAEDMFSLNIEGVEAQYGPGTAKEFRSLDFEYRLTDNTSPLLAFVALGCWSYQCCEGHVPDTPLYKLMDKVYAALAVYIVERSEAYKNAPWG